MSTFTDAVADSAVIAKRNLIKIKRVPDLLVFTTLQPIMFVLLFAYVFGGAVKVPGVNYREFLMAGIFAQTVVFGATLTGAGLADDMQKGIIDRFRSLPMSRSAVLVGRTVSRPAQQRHRVDRDGADRAGRGLADPHRRLARGARASFCCWRFRSPSPGSWPVSG